MTLQRLVLKHIDKQLQNLGTPQEKRRAIILYGPRQAGKTTLVRQIHEKHPQNALYLDCEQFEVKQRFSYENSPNLGPYLKGVSLLILDEAQKIENIGVVLKIIVDHYPDVQVIATGSSSFDLSNKIKEPLTGRKWEFKLLPFSFQEVYGKANRIAQESALEQLLRFGLYPSIVNTSETEARRKLEEITGAYLFKDIFTFQQLKKPELLTKLLQLLAFQVGSEVSFHELAQQLSVDQTVIQKYLFLLEEAFIIFRLGALKRNLRNEITKTRKIYFWDLGIRNTLIQNFNPLNLRNDVGALWENFCVAERLKHHFNRWELPNTYFWRTYDQKEIDYIEEEGGKLQAFEFKWNAEKRVKKPHTFLESYKNSEFEVITRENFVEFMVDSTP